jgi:DNA-binding NtrC family response regulator
MSDSTILTVTSERTFLEVLRKQLHDYAGSVGRMIVASTIDEACSLITAVRPRLLVVHCTRQSESYEQLDQLLWATSLQSRRIPVVVIADRYLTDHAITLYRMGVSEYISRTHHMDQLATIFQAYAHQPSASQSGDTTTASSGSTGTGRVWASGSNQGLNRTAQVV